MEVSIRSFSRVAVMTVVFALLVSCESKEHAPYAIPQVSASVETLLADTTGQFRGKDVAVTGEVVRADDSMVMLGPTIAGRGVECHLWVPVNVQVGDTVTFWGFCRQGDHGPKLDGARIAPR